MAKLTPIAAAIVFVCLVWPGAGHAATDDLAALRAELEALKSDYTSRVQALEARIKQLESAVVTATTAPPAYPQPSPVAPPAKSSNATAFNPAISMILTGNYASLSQDPATYRVAGFIPPPSGEGPGRRSFNLDESELTVASNVDPYFFGNVTAAIQGDNSIDIEEAYFKTIALNNGFTIKGGRFFSATGYLNEIHSHNWDFVDQPLVYQVFLGGQLAQDGAQIRWVAPTDYFIELGAEAGSGRSFPGSQRDLNSLASDALFAHLGGDVEIFAKREDCNSGLAFGGNKLRKLEYIVPDQVHVLSGGRILKSGDSSLAHASAITVTSATGNRRRACRGSMIRAVERGSRTMIRNPCAPRSTMFASAGLAGLSSGSFSGMTAV